MSLESNKEIVRRFNLQVIQEGNQSVFKELMAEGFVNRSAPEGSSSGPESMWHTFQNILRPAMSDLRVTIHSQIAEGDKVTTHKTITGVHDGSLFGIPPTHKSIAIEVIDVVRIEDRQYAEHWGLNTLPQVLASLRKE